MSFDKSEFMSGLPKADMSRCPPMPTIKPPLGLRPRSVVARERLKEIWEAMERYDIAGKDIPGEWMTEYNEILTGLFGEGVV